MSHLVAALLVAGTALAGGWATSQFDEPLPEFTEGGSWLVGFTILQHGQNPVAVEGAGLRFTKTGSGEVLFFEASSGAETGHYVASVARLTPGTWDLEVEQGSLLYDGSNPLHFEPYPIGEVTVAGDTATAATTGWRMGPALPIVVGLIALGVAAAGAFSLRRRTTKEAI